MRASGILLPVASLPSEYGIGAFSGEAYTFIKQLKKAGQSYWQILPLGPTGYGDSPYQSFSTFAGNPYYLDLGTFVERGWLKKKECGSCDFGEDEGRVDYEKILLSRSRLLRKAFARSRIQEDGRFQAFCREQREWLDDYALFMEIKEAHGGVSWQEWEEPFRLRQEEALARFAKEHGEGLLFQKFLQYEFYRQWGRLKRYANKKGIRIIGDIPIYVSLDSADSWAQPELFQFDEARRPRSVAGCPPDAFSATGQLWGNPLYDWAYHRETGYRWWIRRIAHCRELYDVVRIDHFRGFDAYYSIPFGEPTAEHGHWEPGPGLELFRKVEESLGKTAIIAEDLGYLTESVMRMVEESGYPGMKVLEFGFDSREPFNYLPHNYVRNCVAYTGTHDNETLAGWYRAMSPEDRAHALRYLGRKKLKTREAVWAFIRLAQASVADTCIIPIQDYLCLGNEARINHPSTLGGNWTWRLRRKQITGPLLREIREMTEVYGRLPEPETGGKGKKAKKDKKEKKEKKDKKEKKES